MKFLKIILIIVLLCVTTIAYGSGTITSGDNKVTFEKAEPSTLNEWFCGLNLSEKIEIYNNYKGVNHE